MSPGLYKDEKKFVAPLMISTILLFAAGIAFAYFVVCPIIFKFFIASAPNSIQVMTDISQYLNFIIRLVFAFGIAFEIPVATFLLIKSVSQLFLAIPMWILFELGLLVSRDKP